ncbi:hypothetical protein [Kineosporia sp. A_224]|uniref:hypothetical protein n=1 Tax=Kineosporia sp. A_224 TaxID=1962180 RepID=UPI00117BAA9A|nr:hypothetical protein [Kineosporia sp. A_224]
MPGQTGVQVAGRSAAFGVLATCLALLAHAAAGGAVPGPGAFALAALLSATAGAWLAVRAPSLLRAAAGLAVVQVLTHVLFMGAAPMGHTGGTSMTAAHAVAVAATAWLLTRGERAVEAVLARLRADLPGAPRTCVPAASLRPAPDAHHRPAYGRVVVRHLLRRGPPGSLPAVA